MKLEVIVTDVVSPAATEAVVADKVSVSELATGAALVGPEESTPSPNATTTASEIRLNVILDISFLSFSRTRDVPKYG
jgi:hypothetical protein